MPPQLLAIAAIAAGLYTGYRVATRAIGAMREAREADRAASEKATATAAGEEPRDLGRLEWDETARVYRPKAARGQ